MYWSSSSTVFAASARTSAKRVRSCFESSQPWYACHAPPATAPAPAVADHVPDRPLLREEPAERADHRADRAARERPDGALLDLAAVALDLVRRLDVPARDRELERALLVRLLHVHRAAVLAEVLVRDLGSAERELAHQPLHELVVEPADALCVVDKHHEQRSVRCGDSKKLARAGWRSGSGGATSNTMDIDISLLFPVNGAMTVPQCPEDPVPGPGRRRCRVISGSASDAGSADPLAATLPLLRALPLPALLYRPDGTIAAGSAAFEELVGRPSRA